METGASHAHNLNSARHPAHLNLYQALCVGTATACLDLFHALLVRQSMFGHGLVTLISEAMALSTSSYQHLIVVMKKKGGNVWMELELELLQIIV